MAKELNQVQVNLAFTANTNQAKQELRNLQGQLENLLTISAKANKGFNMDKSFLEASKSVATLKHNLEEATNVDTGKLDLGKFSQSMKKSGMSLKKYQDALSDLGPAGDKAFVSLAQSISRAELPLRRSSALLNEMWTTMKNTARWQISSSVLHGFMGSVQKAYYYAKDLNESLNDIRIVTGYSADQMSVFADQANKAAKALNTSTVEYTDAALIYYQQGLSSKEVEDRTDITVKMANVTGEKAEEVSSYMTAIWNNFNDGSESLEYYADVMTALGAATASSTDEIAAGLEKFAAVSDTIGLSYEYATSALATVTAETRQSADVIGTAFKTIFARIQGLNLGETLEDGTTLNKYSEALQKVGISIKDQNGNLKNMDSILNEIGSKWKILDKNTQVALAQTVAGVRQYNQLISLMDNWDIFEKNLATAQGSEGSLQDQADIYAESWEASSKRVRAAMESLYSDLLNDEFFIDINDTIADIVTGLDSVIKNMGGFKSILLLVGSIATSVFKDQILKGITDITYNFRMLTKKGREDLEGFRAESNNLILNMTSDGTTSGSIRADAYQNQAKLQQALVNNAEHMSLEQQKIAQSLLDQQAIMAQQAISSGEELQNVEAKAALKEREFLKIANQKGSSSNSKNIKNILKRQQEAIKVNIAYKESLQDIYSLKITPKSLDSDKKKLESFVKILDELDIESAFGRNSPANSAFKKFEQVLQNSSSSADDLNKAIDNLYSTVDGKIDVVSTFRNELENIFKRKKGSELTKEQTEAIDELIGAYFELGEAAHKSAKDNQELADYTKLVAKSFEEASSVKSPGEMFLAVSSSIGNIVSALNGAKSVVSSLLDDSLSASEKLMSLLTGFTIIMPSIIALIKADNIGTLIAAANKSVLFKNILKLNFAIDAETGALVKNGVVLKGHPIFQVLGIITAVIAGIQLLIKLTTWMTDRLMKGEEVNKELYETQLKENEVTKELINSNKELSNSLGDLINQYDVLNSRGEDTTNVLEEIKEKTPDLIESYQELNEAMNLDLDEKVKNLENYAKALEFDKVEDIIGDIERDVSIESAKQEKSSITDRGYLLAASGQDNGAKVLGTDLSLTAGGVDFKGEETEAAKILKDNLGDKYTSKPGLMKVGGTIELGDFTNPNDFIETYEKVRDARNEMLENDSIVESSDIYREINEFLQGTSEQYEALTGQIGNYNEASLKAVSAELEKEGAYKKNIETVAEYKKYLEDYNLKAKENYNLTEEQTEAYLNQDPVLQYVAAKSKIIDNLENIYSSKYKEKYKLNEQDKAGIEEELNKLTSEQLQVVVGVTSTTENFEGDYQERIQKGFDQLYEERGEKLAESLDVDANALEAYTQHLMESNDGLKENRDLAQEVAAESILFSENLDKLEKSLEKNAKTIKKADKNNLDYFESLGEVQSALEEAFGVNVNEDFIADAKNLELIEAAATGDIEAVERLREALSQDILARIVGETNFDDVQNDVQELSNSIVDTLSNSDIEIGASLDSKPFLKDAQELVDTTKMSVEEAQAYFNSLGYEPVFETVEEEIDSQIPNERSHTDYIITEGKIQVGRVELPYPTIDQVTKTWVDGYTPIKEKRLIPLVSGDGKTPVLKELRKKGTAAPVSSSHHSGGSRGGGGKKSSPAKPKKVTEKSEVVERYKEINDSLKTLAESYSDANRESDRLYGQNKLNAMDKESQITKKQIQALKEKEKQIKKFLEIDKKALLNNKYKIKFEIDQSSGNITNYTQIMDSLYNQLNSAEKKLNSLKTSEAQSKYEESTLQPIQNKIDYLKELIKQYEETNQLLIDNGNEIIEKINEEQDRHFEKLNTRLELKITINDNNLKEIEYYLDKISDDFYKMAESLGYLLDKGPMSVDNLWSYKDYGESIESSYQSGKISQEQYVEGLIKTRDGIIEELSALNQLDKEMLHYYGDTLEAADSELRKYTDHMEHLSEVLDHYTNLMGVLGKQKDFKAMGDFLSGKASITKDQLDVAQSNYEMLQKQKAKIEARMAGVEEGSAAYEVYKKEWDAIVAATDEAQSEVLSLTEEWAENMKAVIENNLEAAADSLEKTLTDGVSFDTLITEMDRLHQREEEYLTQTNKMYKTNQLIRTAQQDFDKTNSEVAKRKISAFMDETKALQTNSKLSQYELDIQKAKYDILVAELALEDAKDAKNSMRLVRNDQGNYDYVYTADEEKISSAQQDLEDAQNNLYNISLNGQKEYSEKYIEAMNQMRQELKDLQLDYLNGEIATEEEYNQKKEAIVNHYFGEDGILTTYSHLYKTAFNADADAARDNWFKNYGEMTQKTEEWHNAVVNDYLPKVEEETERWQDISVEANKQVGDALQNSADITKELTEESSNLAEIVENDVIDAIEQEINAVEEMTAAYADQREGLQALIAEMERYLALVGKKISSQSAVSEDYSLKMLEAFKDNDFSAVQHWSDKRVEKENSGNYTSVSTSRVNKIIEEAKKGDPEANAIIDKVLNGEMTLTDHNLKGTKFKTGGYTGAWGEEGKLAVLHEKELVLNKEDTSNILSAVDVIRSVGPNMINQIKEFLDNNVLKNSLFGMISFKNNSLKEDRAELEQNIIIHADFPGVSAAIEIEEALRSLANNAAQYASIRKY